MDTRNVKKYGIPAALALVLLVVAVVFFGGSDRRKGPLVADDLRITRVFSENKERDTGFLYLPYARTEQADSHRYVNVAVDLNGDGAFAAYEVDGKRQEEWLVRDMASFAANGGTNGFPVAIPDRGWTARLPLRAAVAFSASAAGGEAWPAPADALPLHVRTYAIDDRDEFYVTDGKGEMDTGSPVSGGRRLAVATGGPANNPAEPQEYSARHEGIPDQNQKYNECSPTGISNNFRWLARTYGFEDRMPDTTEALINELKGDLLWDNGVTPGQNTIAGKRAFIERRGLPLEAHLIGEEFDPNIQHKIYEELKKGQAVEIGILFLETVDGEERAAGAHLVGVSGTLRYGPDRFIQLVDPGTSSASSDGSGSETYRLNGNVLTDYDTSVKSVIRFAYAQSPIFDADENLVYPDQTGTALQIGETPRAAADERFTMARSNFGFFNVTMDDIGDHMVGESFTARATVHWTGRETTMRYWDEATGTARSFTFGAGRPWGLRGHFMGSPGKLSPYLAEHLPDQMSVPGRSHEVQTTFRCESPGLAKVKYVAFLSWPRTGEPRPAGVRENYRAQIDATSHMVTVESPPFRCLTPAPPAEEPRTAAPFSCPGVEPTTDGVDIEVLVIDGQCYPVSQFHVAEPDACGERHWHWNGSPVVSFTDTKKNDPNTSGCGFGTVGELTPQAITVGQDDAARFLGGVMDR